MYVNPMQGKGVIVMRLSDGYSDNGHRYYEHSSIQGAKGEAHRLAASIGGRFVVYVPVAIIEPAPSTHEQAVEISDMPRVEIPFNDCGF